MLQSASEFLWPRSMNEACLQADCKSSVQFSKSMLEDASPLINASLTSSSRYCSVINALKTQFY